MKKFNRYPKYKDSGVAWLGEIPEHWEARKLKFVFKILKRIAGKLGYPVLSITQQGIKVKDIESGHGQLSMDYSKYQLAYPGEFAMNHMDLITGYVDVSKFEGVVSPDYRVFSLIDPNSDKAYLLSLLQFCYKRKIFYTYGQGVSQFGRWRLPATNFNNFLFPIPPKDEQLAIGKFLNYKLSKIDRFIRKKKQLIKLLKEQKAAIINRAVTKGLDPNVAMKDSGIEWLGEIPQHWEVRKLKYVATVNPTKGDSGYSKEDDYEVVFLPMEKVSEGGKIDNSIKLPIAQVWDGYTYFKKGDVVFAKITPCFENGKGAFLSELETEIGFGTTEFTVLRPKIDMISGSYLYLILNSKSFRLIGERFMEGAAGQKRVPTDFVKNFTIAIPSKNEQDQIEKFIIRENIKIHTTISKIEKEITLTEEYRTALIAEAVTGKIDVRAYVIPDTDSYLQKTEEEGDDDLTEELSLAADDAEAYLTEELEE